MQRRLAEIAAALGGTVDGNPDRLIRGVAPLDRADESQLSFLANKRYRKQALETRAGAVIVEPDEEIAGRDLIRVANPYLALARALELFAPPPAAPRGVHPGATMGAGCALGEEPHIEAGTVVGDHVVIGDRVRVLAGAVIGDGVRLGDDCVIHPRVCIYPGVRLGSRVIIHAGSVVGSDGFGYAAGEETPVKVPQVGGVVIEDDVEIGACVCIDRGTLGDTVIERGARIDNLVQIAHNVRVGAGSLLAAQTGISGSTRLGRGVMMAGQSGIVGHIEIGDGARVGAKSAVTRKVPAGEMVGGIPAISMSRWRRAAVLFGKLPELFRRVAALEKRGDT